MEYAILFIVLSILFIGGAELGMAALASYKNTDAAKTGISEYAEVNQRRLNILNAEKQYLISLSSYDSCVRINNDGDCDSAGAIDNYILYLDEIFLNTESFGLAFTQLQDEVDTNPSINSPSDLMSDLNTIDDLFQIENDLLTSIIPANNNAEGQLKYRALLLIAHYKLSFLPLRTDRDDDGIPDTRLSIAAFKIGNHASADFRQPSCNADGSYDEGFPNNRYDIKDGDSDQSGRELFLFNPLPIDNANCNSKDSARAGRSRLSILIGGYGNPDDPLYVQGLPKLNQAMYGMYKSDLNGNLIPPGKMCTSDDVCPNQPNDDLYITADAVGPTGYYRWNKGSDGSGKEDLFKYTINNVNDDLQTGFRPAMQMDCSASPNPEGEISGTFGNINDINCQLNYSKVRVHTRYRKIFEGFLTFGLQELNTPNDPLDTALALFYNPNDVGVPGSNQVNGTIDSEIGSLGANGIPTIKRHKDFRGCYEVDVATNQISACN